MKRASVAPTFMEIVAHGMPVPATARRAPSLDRLAAQGWRFPDDRAEASRTAGRANFIIGKLPIRAGH